MSSHRAVTAFRFALVAAVLVAAPVFGLTASAAPRAGAPVLVVAPPWSGGPAAVIDRSGGREIGPARAPFAAVAMLDDPALARAAGAWAVLDAAALAALCGPRSLSEDVPS
ncbi:hypothetical protein HKCCE2091_19005 [Rhodobacterales bacterium HKCCE2091]|nr:hypothetical protein [Rhodobacterales bacterium HKCCE2091]